MIEKLMNDIIDYCELTYNSKDNNYIMNKWRLDKKDYLVNEEVALCLIQSEILGVDSANWETRDWHYILDYFHKNKISKINYMLNKLNSNLYNSEIIERELLNIKNKEERKIKLNILKN